MPLFLTKSHVPMIMFLWIVCSHHFVSVRSTLKFQIEEALRGSNSQGVRQHTKVTKCHGFLARNGHSTRLNCVSHGKVTICGCTMFVLADEKHGQSCTFGRGCCQTGFLLCALGHPLDMLSKMAQRLCNKGGLSLECHPISRRTKFQSATVFQVKSMSCTGKIVHVGAKPVECNINAFASCSGSVVFLLDVNQPQSVEASDFGCAVAIHSGAQTFIT